MVLFCDPESKCKSTAPLCRQTFKNGRKPRKSKIKIYQKTNVYDLLGLSRDPDG